MESSWIRVPVGINLWRPDATRSLKMEVSGHSEGWGQWLTPTRTPTGAQTALRVDENDTSTYSVRLDSPPLDETVIMASQRESFGGYHLTGQGLTFKKGTLRLDNPIPIQEKLLVGSV